MDLKEQIVYLLKEKNGSMKIGEISDELNIKPIEVLTNINKIPLNIIERELDSDGDITGIKYRKA